MENLMTEAPLVGGIVIIVIAFISHLNKRDREVRKILEMFSERRLGRGRVLRNYQQLPH